ncbi:hypothetical protein LTR62_001828 [Meristemomyces frigidus]|uniref:Copper transport protein n=1 Tax=Meristemomyces frigidus TaxID=1508187 RepID=A0AAN7YQH8_9PEZI|nr:hypothetical protein LTR62_001828 [Meristemomyces frigidus]
MDRTGKSDSGSSSMTTMGMVFVKAQNTPLYSKAWTPSTTGGYASTCIFLLILAITSRMLLAYRTRLERSWHDKAINRRYIMISGQTEADRERQAVGKGGEKTEVAVLTANGTDERVKVVRSAGRNLEGKPWRFSTDLPRAALFTVDSGVKYLLMLAVMTMNVGYFFSVLAGLFVGELAIGRYTGAGEGHH